VVDDGLPADPVLDERERRRRREPWQRLGVELSGEHERARRMPRPFVACRGLVERRNHRGGAVRDRGDDGRSREQDIEHDRDLARHAHRVELLLATEDVDLVPELDRRRHHAGRRAYIP
jgi:hypothetical protein